MRISWKKNFDLDNHEKSSFLKKCWALSFIDFGETLLEPRPGLHREIFLDKSSLLTIHFLSIHREIFT
jgi:hypothetical protein